MEFFLGTHRPNWLEQLNVPLFVSHRTLVGRRTLPRARGPWALDSGGFSELSMFGEWRTTPTEYVTATRRYAEEIGQLEFAAPQDWMCEPWIIEKTGLSVRDHQKKTVANYLLLQEMAPDLPFMPVLQGWTLDDYRHHADMYATVGVDLPSLPRVGLGSVCRRNQMGDTETIVYEMARAGVRLHGFGVKTAGLQLFGDSLASADSMAWSFTARRNPPLPGCTHKACANCPLYALQWRQRLLDKFSVRQMRLEYAA